MYRFEVFLHSVVDHRASLLIDDEVDISSLAVAFKLLQYPLTVIWPSAHNQATSSKEKQARNQHASVIEFGAGKCCSFAANSSSLCSRLQQAPLSLLYLGPSGTGGPSLLGVATLQLLVHRGDDSLGSICYGSFQQLPLISPAGHKIGCITAAARVVDCTLSPLRQSLAVAEGTFAKGTRPALWADSSFSLDQPEHVRSNEASQQDIQPWKFAAASQPVLPVPLQQVPAAVQTDAAAADNAGQSKVASAGSTWQISAAVQTECGHQSDTDNHAQPQDANSKSAPHMVAAAQTNLREPQCPDQAAPLQLTPLQAASEEQQHLPSGQDQCDKALPYAQTGGNMLFPAVTQPIFHSTHFHLYPMQQMTATTAVPDAVSASKQLGMQLQQQQQPLLQQTAMQRQKQEQAEEVMQQLAQHVPELPAQPLQQELPAKQQGGDAQQQPGVSQLALQAQGVGAMAVTTDEQLQSPSIADVQQGDSDEFESWCPMTAVPVPTSFRLRAQEKSQRVQAIQQAFWQRSPVRSPCSLCVALQRHARAGKLQHNDVYVPRYHWPASPPRSPRLLRNAIADTPRLCPACLQMHTSLQQEALSSGPVADSQHAPVWPNAKAAVTVADNSDASQSADRGAGLQPCLAAPTPAAMSEHQQQHNVGSNAVREVNEADQPVAAQSPASNPLESKMVQDPIISGATCSQGPWGRSGLPAAAVLQQLHTALADIEQLKADLLNTAQPPQPTEQAAPAVPAEQAVPAVPAVPGKKRLRRKPATGATAQTRPGLFERLLHQRLGHANRPALEAVPTADAATQSEHEINAGAGEQSLKTLSVSRSQVPAEQSYGRSSISRRRQGGHYSEQPCLRAQRERIVPGSPAAILGRQQKLVLTARRQRLSSQQASLTSLNAPASSGHSTPSSHEDSMHTLDASSAGEHQLTHQLVDSVSEADVFPSNGSAGSCPGDEDGAEHQQHAALDAPASEDSASDQAEAVQQADNEGAHMEEALHDAAARDTAAVVVSHDADATQVTEPAQHVDVPSISEIVNSAAERVATAAAAATAADDRNAWQLSGSVPAIHPHGKQQGRHTDSGVGQRRASHTQDGHVDAEEGEQIAAQYPWMRHSIDEEAEGAPGRLQPHVTFGENALLSVAKLQSGKVPLSYVAAAAADKANRDGAEVHRHATHHSYPMMVGDVNTDAFTGQQGMSAKTSLLHSGEQEASDTHLAAPSRLDALPLRAMPAAPGLPCDHDRQSVITTAQQGYDIALQPAAWQSNGGSSLAQDALHSFNVEQAADKTADEPAHQSGSGSTASYAHSAASGLSHLMRAQQPWSTTSSSRGSSHEEPAQDISQLQANILTPLDMQQTMHQQEQHAMQQQEQRQAGLLSLRDEQQNTLRLPTIYSGASQAESLPDEETAAGAHAAASQQEPASSTDAEIQAPEEMLSEAVHSSEEYVADRSWHMDGAPVLPDHVAHPLVAVSPAFGPGPSEATIGLQLGSEQQGLHDDLGSIAAGEQILQQAESEVSDIYSEVFEDDELQASLVKEYSDAESVQSSWHSPDLQMEPAANAYIQTSGTLLKPQVFSYVPTTEPISTRPGSIVKAGTVAYR